MGTFGDGCPICGSAGREKPIKQDDVLVNARWCTVCQLEWIPEKELKRLDKLKRKLNK